MLSKRPWSHEVPWRLWRLAIDETSGESEGAPEPIVGGFEVSIALPSPAEHGRALFFRSEALTTNPVAIPFDPETETAGAPRELPRRSGSLRPTGVSPDGQWLALFSLGELREDIFLLRTDGSALRRLTDDVAYDRIHGSLPTTPRSRSYQTERVPIRATRFVWTKVLSPSWRKAHRRASVRWPSSRKGALAGSELRRLLCDRRSTVASDV